jgi:hypothetical protein
MELYTHSNMDIKNLSQVLAVKLYLLEDTRKAAELLYDIIQNSIESASKQDAARDYVTQTIEVLSGIDSAYADKIAADYLQIIKINILQY